MGETKCIERCGNLTLEGSDMCEVCLYYKKWGGHV